MRSNATATRRAWAPWRARSRHCPLTPAPRSKRFNVSTVPARLPALPRDPWSDFTAAPRPLTASMQCALGLRD